MAAIQAQDGDALEAAVEKEGAEEVGEQSGATLYEDDDGDTVAIKDDVLVVAGSKELLEAALEQREADDRLTEEVFEQSLEDLPDEGLVRAYGDLGALIENDPETADARKVEWVAALDTFGLTAERGGGRDRDRLQPGHRGRPRRGGPARRGGRRVAGRRARPRARWRVGLPGPEPGLRASPRPRGRPSTHRDTGTTRPASSSSRSSSTSRSTTTSSASWTATCP